MPEGAAGEQQGHLPLLRWAALATMGPTSQLDFPLRNAQSGKPDEQQAQIAEGTRFGIPTIDNLVPRADATFDDPLCTIWVGVIAR